MDPKRDFRLPSAAALASEAKQFGISVATLKTLYIRGGGLCGGGGCHRPRGGRAGAGVSFDPSTYGTDTNPVVTDFLAELLHDPDPMAAELGSVLGRGSFNATYSARRYDHFLNDARASGSYATAVREAWGRLQAATAGHLRDADAREMEREAEAASGSQKELTAFLDHANNSRLRNEVDDLFQQAVPLGNTVPRDELKDLVPDSELSLPAFNVVTGSYDPRSLKPTLLEFKTMRYGVKYTAVPQATAVDRFERSLLETDMQRGLAARDAAWHNTEPGQKGPLRDILHMSEYTGMVFGTVGDEVSKGTRLSWTCPRSTGARQAHSERSAPELQGDLLLGQKAQRATSKRVLLCAAVCGGLLLVLAIGFGVGFGTAPQSPGKTSWPECVGWTPEACKTLITSQRPDLKLAVLTNDSPRTMDFDTERVRILYQRETGLITHTPTVG
eukprot:jgi/Tetstr1/438637/TSEL_027188.t1